MGLTIVARSAASPATTSSSHASAAPAASARYLRPSSRSAPPPPSPPPPPPLGDLVPALPRGVPDDGGGSDIALPAPSDSGTASGASVIVDSAAPAAASAPQPPRRGLSEPLALPPFAGFSLLGFSRGGTKAPAACSRRRLARPTAAATRATQASGEARRQAS